MLADVDKPSLEQAVAHLQAQGFEAHGVMCDVRYLKEMIHLADEAFRLLGQVDVVFCHNDLLAANFIDDGSRLWLVDWDYAGFNSPLFDLANLASHAGLDAEQEAWVLSTYFGRTPDVELLRSYRAMKCASLLREAMWSMVSEIHSQVDFDFAKYTADNLARYEKAYAGFAAMRRA